MYNIRQQDKVFVKKHRNPCAADNLLNLYLTREPVLYVSTGLRRYYYG